MAIRIPYGDDEQFDLAAWFHSCYNRLRCYTSWSVYIFMYFGCPSSCISANTTAIVLWALDNSSVVRSVVFCSSIVNDLMFSSAKISIIPDYAKYFGKKLSSRIVGNGTRSKVGQGLPNEQRKSCSLFGLCYVESTSNLRRTYIEPTSNLHRTYIEATPARHRPCFDAVKEYAVL